MEEDKFGGGYEQEEEEESWQWSSVSESSEQLKQHNVTTAQAGREVGRAKFGG